jgi:alkylation response protein AidB-like acyl-CoA dehydrogenase
MAWDFSTEPEFEEKLEWMRGFVREEVYPLETLDLTYDQVRVLIRPLQEQVKAEGLWAAHLPPELGGMGFGQVRQQRAGFGERGVAGGGDRGVGERGAALAVVAALVGWGVAVCLFHDGARHRWI